MAELCVAIRNGRYDEAVIRLRAFSVDVSWTDERGRTPLHWAARQAEPGIVAGLLRLRSQINAEDKEMRTPLLCALQCRSQEQERMICVRILLDAGANVHHRDNDGQNALHYAARNGYPSIVQHLLTVDPSLCPVENCWGRNALLCAVAPIAPKSSNLEEEDRLSCVRILMEAGADVCHRDKGGLNAFHYAACYGYPSIVQHLLSVDPNLCRDEDCWGRTAFICAVAPIATNSSNLVEEDRLSCVRILMEAGADVGHRDKDGLNALHYAARNGYPSIVRHLLTIDPSLCVVQTFVVMQDISFPSNVHHGDNEGLNALHYATRNGYPSIVRHLVTIDSSLCDVENPRGQTPLLYALKKGDRFCRIDGRLDESESVLLSCLMILLQNSVNVQHRDKDGLNVLHYATRGGYHSIVRYLLTVDPSLCPVEDNCGRTALLCAAAPIARNSFHYSEEDRLSCVRILIDAYADVGHRDKDGLNALHRATSNGYPSIVRHLLIVDPSLCHVENAQGQTPLLYAFKKGDIYCRSDDVDGTVAIESVQLECLMILLQNRADVHHRDKHGLNALHYAACNGYPSIVRYLLTHDPSLCLVEDNRGRTPLLSAVHSGPFRSEEDQLSCVRILMDAGGDVCHRDKGGTNALHYAAHNGYPSIIRHLLTVDPTLCAVKDGQGRTALLYCIPGNRLRKESVQLECLKILLQNGADVHHRDKDGLNVFHYATRERYHSIVRHLLTVDPSLC
ncbi:unnamed protein product [Cyprideis torosa]|uniref:Uncharacterized protein n=1 Tax=Cyprideis torosa TaxID=163714 RepID=A0A7R8WLV4_9CRUS|nr:unnamed protein product [Cyprideis torosa]CAG0904725.1 unnamed protein product [Cyprideis torosa]